MNAKRYEAENDCSLPGRDYPSPGQPSPADAARIAVVKTAAAEHAAKVQSKRDAAAADDRIQQAAIYVFKLARRAAAGDAKAEKELAALKPMTPEDREQVDAKIAELEQAYA